MEKFKFKNKPELKFIDSKPAADEQKGSGIIWWPGFGATKGDCDIHTVSEPGECQYFGVDWTITGKCIA